MGSDEVVISQGKVVSMMRSKSVSLRPIAEVTLEDLVQGTHFYRHLDHDLDLSLKCEQVKEILFTAWLYSFTGRRFLLMGDGKSFLPT